MQNNVVETNQLIVRNGGTVTGYVLSAADNTGTVQWTDVSSLISPDIDVNSLGSGEPITTTAGTITLPGPVNFKTITAGDNITLNTSSPNELQIAVTPAISSGSYSPTISGDFVVSSPNSSENIAHWSIVDNTITVGGTFFTISVNVDTTERQLRISLPPEAGLNPFPSLYSAGGTVNISPVVAGSTYYFYGFMLADTLNPASIVFYVQSNGSTGISPVTVSYTFTASLP